MEPHHRSPGRAPGGAADDPPHDDVRVRLATRADVPAARALIVAELDANPYAARALELVDEIGGGSEYEGMVAEAGGRIVGVGIFGLVAGSQGAGSMYAAAVDRTARRRGVGRALVHAAADTLAARGARFVIVEVADDPSVTQHFIELLAASGFGETARVPDLYRDGVALAFWRRDL